MNTNADEKCSQKPLLLSNRNSSTESRPSGGGARVYCRLARRKYSIGAGHDAFVGHRLARQLCARAPRAG